MKVISLTNLLIYFNNNNNSKFIIKLNRNLFSTADLTYLLRICGLTSTWMRRRGCTCQHSRPSWSRTTTFWSCGARRCTSHWRTGRTSCWEYCGLQRTSSCFSCLSVPSLTPRTDTTLMNAIRGKLLYYKELNLRMECYTDCAKSFFPEIECRISDKQFKYAGNRYTRFYEYKRPDVKLGQSGVENYDKCKGFIAENGKYDFISWHQRQPRIHTCFSYCINGDD